MRDILIAMIIIGSAPYIVMRPHIGVYMWTWLSYMNPHRLTYGFAYSFPFNQFIAALTIGAYIFNKEPKKFPWTSLTVVWVTFVIWISITTVTAINPEHSAVEWQRSMKIHIMILFTLLLVNDKERIQALVWVLALSIAFYGIKGGVFTIATGGQHLVWGPPFSFIAGNNEIAFALVITQPLLFYLVTITKNKYIKLALIGSMILCIAAILGSYSRGAFLATAAMGTVLTLKSDKKIPILLAVIAFGAVAVSVMPAKYMERMGTIQTYDQDASALGRINAWYFAVNLANDRPIVGGGFDTFVPELFPRYAKDPDDFHDAHSIYFEVLAEHGYVGLGIFLSLGFLTLINCGRIIRDCRRHDNLRWAERLAAMVQVSIVGYSVGGAFLGLAYWEMVYNLMAISVLVRKAAEAELKKMAEEKSQAVEQPAFHQVKWT